jgi:hypothetical protein
VAASTLAPSSQQAFGDLEEHLRSVVHDLANRLQHALYALEAAESEARHVPNGALREHLAEALEELVSGVETTHRVQSAARALVVGAAAPAGGDAR